MPFGRGRVVLVGTAAGDLAGDAVFSATGTHWEEDKPDYWNMNTDIRTTAIVIWALSRLEPDVACHRLTVHLHRAGGLPAVIRRLLDAGLSQNRAEFILDKQERFQYDYMRYSYEYRHLQDKSSERGTELKEQLELGNRQAQDWIFFAVQRLTTSGAAQLAEEILATESFSWWFDRQSDWWVNGANDHHKKRQQKD